MIKMDEKDRRNWVRAKRVLSIQYRVVKSVKKIIDPAWHLSMTEDMSAGGIAFYSESPYRKGDILEIHVVMSGVLDIFNGCARVVRVTKQKNRKVSLVAVKFQNKNSSVRSAKSYTTRKAPAKTTTKRV
ncbi:MAG: PilZ domain-containing protein [Candidatus Omnitrophica bacterium]|nr:PilZ domain-containing protein [Candidatus Omnitrophota bacterium]